MRNYVATIILFLVATAKGTIIPVTAGDSIQAAVNRAKPGDIIEVASGVYKESVVINNERITLRGRPGDTYPILDGENKRNDGVISSGSGFKIQNFRIQNYKGNGVMTQGANDVVIRDIEVRYTGIYGIYPTRGRNILVERTVTWGIADAGIYIGMCENVDVRFNEVFASVAGIEGENSTNVLIERNSVHDNSGGILVFNLPGLPVKHGENTIIRNNTIVANNLKNFGPEGSIVATVPPGSGIILLAADKVTIENNVISDNQSGGIIIADHEYIKDVAALDPQVEPNSDYNRILKNEFKNNGSRQKGALRWALIFQYFTFKGRDILATDTGKGNCILAGVTTSIKGTSTYQECKDEARPATSFYREFASQAPSQPLPLGESVYQAVCAGCHAMGMQRIGPPIEEIQQKYAGQPDGIVAFANAPRKVRPKFPDMPSQAYLGKEKLQAVAKFILEMK